MVILGPSVQGFLENSPVALPAVPRVRLKNVMRSSNPTAPELPADEGCVAPLTQATRDGRPYKRRDDIEAEIGRAIAGDPTSWQIEPLKSETIVYLLRWLRRHGKDAMLGPLLDHLARRISRIAKDFVQDCDKSTAEDIVTRVGEDVVDQVFAQTVSRQSEFLEISFRQAVRRRTLNQIEKRKSQPRFVQFSSAAGNQTDRDDRSSNTIEALASADPNPEDAVLESETRALTPERIRTGLAAITDARHREAIILHFLQGWPITDQNPETPTLTRHFRVSARSISTWIKGALAEMRDAIGENP